MRFVLAAYRKTRRRVQLENLLLLLARMLAVAALAFAVARPFASGDSPLAGLREERRDLVLVLDGSASMGLRGEVKTVHEEMIERATALIEDLDGLRGSGPWCRRRASPGVPRDRPEDAAAILDTLDRPLDEDRDLAAAFGVVADALEDDRDVGMLGAVDAAPDRSAGRPFDRRSSSAAAKQDSGDAPPPPREQVARLDALEIKAVVDLGVALRPKNLSVSSRRCSGTSPAQACLRRGRRCPTTATTRCSPSAWRWRSAASACSARGRARPRHGGGDLHRGARDPGAPRPRGPLAGTASASTTGAPSAPRRGRWRSCSSTAPPRSGSRTTSRVSARSSNRPTTASAAARRSALRPHRPHRGRARQPRLHRAGRRRPRERAQLRRGGRCRTRAAGAGLVIHSVTGSRPRSMVREPVERGRDGPAPRAPEPRGELGPQDVLPPGALLRGDPPRAALLQRRAAATAPHRGADLRLRPDARARAERALARDPRRPGG